MKRLIHGLGLNSPKAYDEIFKERRKEEINWADMRRWKALLKYYKKGELLVDLGCLDSEIVNLIDSWDYTGIDTAETAVEIMQYRHPEAYFIVRDIYNTKCSGLFGYVVLGEVLEHLERPEDAVREAFSILKPGGVLAISVPLDEYKEPGAVDGDRHIWSFSKDDIKTLVEPYAKKVKIKILRSTWFPYRYCWPQLIVYAWKK